MVAPTLLAEEYQYKDTGFKINADVALPFIDLTKVSGLDSTDVRTSQHDREGLHGGYIDAEFESLRTVILEGTLYASTTGFEATVDTLKANFAPSAVANPLYLGTDAGTRVVYGKSLGFKYDKDTLRRLGSCACMMQIVCEDPRIYSPNISTLELTVATTIATGRSFPKSYPYGYGPASTSASLVFPSGGNREQPAIFRIYGPIVNPVITNLATGTAMYFNLTIDTGSYLEINLNNKTVKLNGTAGRRNKLTMIGNWYFLQPGNNTFSLQGSSTLAGTTKLTVTASDAAWR